MKVRKKPGIESVAQKLHGSGRYESARGEIQEFEEGDYLMTTEEGDQYIVTGKYFDNNYELVPEY